MDIWKLIENYGCIYIYIQYISGILICTAIHQERSVHDVHRLV